MEMLLPGLEWWTGTTNCEEGTTSVLMDDWIWEIKKEITQLFHWHTFYYISSFHEEVKRMKDNTDFLYYQFVYILTSEGGDSNSHCTEQVDIKTIPLKERVTTWQLEKETNYSEKHFN